MSYLFFSVNSRSIFPTYFSSLELLLTLDPDRHPPMGEPTFVGRGAGLVCLTGVVDVGFLGVARFVAGCTLALSEGFSLYSQQPFSDTWDNTRIVEWLLLSRDRIAIPKTSADSPLEQLEIS
ncbi:hypothetical protein Tco_0281304 [Tanacetum coccineum]